MNYNWNIYPPDGRVFTDVDGTIHRGESWKDLFKKIKNYRAVNQFDPGDPEVEVTIQLCAKTPHFCSHSTSAMPATHHSLNFNARVLQWVGILLGYKRLNKVPRVDDATAAARAAICSRCPAQRALNSSCEACIASVKVARKILLNNSTSLHQNLSCCLILAEDCSLSVHIQQPASGEALPAHCWRRK